MLPDGRLRLLTKNNGTLSQQLKASIDLPHTVTMATTTTSSSPSAVNLFAVGKGGELERLENVALDLDRNGSCDSPVMPLLDG